MRQLFNLILLFAAIIAGLQTHAQVRPPIEANTVRALNELDAQQALKFQGDALVKSEMAYIEWSGDCFRFRRITTGSAWSDWLCIDDGEQTTIGVNAQSAFEIISNALNFKVQNKHTVLQSDAGNNFVFKGNVILGENFTALGFGAGQSGFDSLVAGGDTILIPAFNNQFDNVILIGHGAQERAPNTAVIGDSSLVRIWTAAAVDASALEIKGDSVFLRHLVNLVEADSGKIAMHNGSGVVWIPQKADSIQINGEWVELGGAFSFSDSIQVNGVWVHLGGSFTTPDAQNLSWDPETGALGISGGTGVDLDGRYLQSETPQNLSWDPETGTLGISGGPGVDLDGRYLIPPTATDGDMMIYAAGSWYATAPIDERVSVIDSEGAKSAPALLSSDDFSVSQVGGAVDDWVVSVKKSYQIDLGTVYGSKEFDIQYNSGNYEYVYVDTLALSGSISNFINTGKYLVSTIDTTITLMLNANVALGFDAVEQATLDLVVNGVSTELFSTSSDSFEGISETLNIDFNIGDSVLFVASISHLSSTFNDTPVFSLTAKGSRITGEIVIPPTYLYNEAVGEWISDSDTIKTNKDLLYAKNIVATDSLQVGTGAAIKRTGSMAEKDIWTGTQAQYDLIGTPDANTVYFINNGWWALALLLLFSFSGFGQKWDAVKIGSTDIVRIYQGGDLIWEKEAPEPTFPEVTIGTQTWMSVNLDIDDGLGGIYAYGNNEANVATYGRLYTWDAAVRVAASIDGWHLPSDAEWITLTTYLGGLSVAGGKLKETGTTHWRSPNTGATNETGFTALPGGHRVSSGTFNNIGNYGNWWGATATTATNARFYYVGYNGSWVTNGSDPKGSGYSVRLIKDTP